MADLGNKPYENLTSTKAVSDPVPAGTQGDYIIGSEIEYYDVAEIFVEVWDISGSSPVKIAFDKGADYTVVGGVDDKVIFNTEIPVDHVGYIYRDSDLIQSTKFARGAFPPESTTEQMNKIVMQVQGLDERVDRALLTSRPGTPISEEDISLIALSPARLDEVEDVLTEYVPKIDEMYDTDIPDLKQRVTTLEADAPAIDPRVVVITSSAQSPFTPLYGQTVIVNTTDTIQIDLPAPDPDPEGEPKIVVKFTENIDNKTVAATALLDGLDVSVATGNPLEPLASYESFTFVSDGTEWYII